MADLAAGLPPALAENVTVVFVTVDPKRDTPAVLEESLSRFDRDFTGLIGPMEHVHELERSLYVPGERKFDQQRVAHIVSAD